jgi:hypothetical protein
MGLTPMPSGRAFRKSCADGRQGNNMADDIKYFGNDVNAMRSTLGRMVQAAYVSNNYSKPKCYQTVRHLLDHDRRFDSYDKERLLAKLEECGKTRGRLDLNDPYLLGGQKRPLTR